MKADYSVGCLAMVMALGLGLFGCDRGSASSCAAGQSAPCSCPDGLVGIRRCTERGIWNAMCESCQAAPGTDQGGDTDPVEVAACTPQSSRDCLCSGAFEQGTQACQADSSWGECSCAPACAEGQSRECACPGEPVQKGTQGCAGGAWTDCQGCIVITPLDPTLADIGKRCKADADCQSKKCLLMKQPNLFPLGGYCLKACASDSDCQKDPQVTLNCLEVTGAGKTCVYACPPSGRYACAGNDQCVQVSTGASACFPPANQECNHGASRCVAADANLIEVCLAGKWKPGKCNQLGSNQCEGNRCTPIFWRSKKDPNLCFAPAANGVIGLSDCTSKPWSAIRLEDGSGLWVVVDTSKRCLNVPGGQLQSGSSLNVGTCSGSAIFWFQDFNGAKNATQFRSALTPNGASFCLDYADASTPKGIQASPCSTTPDTQFWQHW